MKYFVLLMVGVLFFASCDTEDLCDVAGLHGGDCYYNRIQNGNDLRGMLDAFVEDAAQYDIDLSYVYRYPISLTIRNDVMYNGYHYGALAYGRCDDERVEIAFERTTWDYLSNMDKLRVMYHELGHDIFNLDHSDHGPAIMNYSGNISAREFLSLKDKMFRGIATDGREFSGHVKRYDVAQYTACQYGW